MTQENRRFSRIHFWGAAELTVAGKLFSIEKVVDLSVGGCHFSLVADVAKGDACQVKLFLGYGQVTVEAGGDIAWIDDGTVAISFTSISPENLQHLKNIIRYNAPDAEKVEEEMRAHPGIK